MTMRTKRPSPSRQLALRFQRPVTPQSDVTSAENRRSRVALLLALPVLWGVLVVGRLYTLQIGDQEQYLAIAQRQHGEEVTIASERGPILDREGRFLAVSVPATSLYVRPRQVKNVAESARLLASQLDRPVSEVEQLLRSTKPFVWLGRQLPPVMAERVLALKIPGVGEIVESKRYYPFNGSASTVLGRVGIDGKGLSGLESQFNAQLGGESTSMIMARDAFGNSLQLAAARGETFVVPRGEPLQLTIDGALQQIVDEHLEAGRAAYRAKSAVAVLIDARSGDILALSQAPAVNFNQGVRGASALRNPIVEEVFEPGSITKPLVLAAALHDKKVAPSTLIDCEKGVTVIGGHRIKDVHPAAVIPAAEVLIRSSNIGMAKIGALLGRESLHNWLQKFGLNEEVSLGLPGGTAGLLRRPERWATVDVATHSFGHGFASSALQLTRAFASLVNDGALPQLSLIADDVRVSEPIIDPDVAATVRDLLVAAVEDRHGTGKNAAIPGVRVGGKTGTAEVPRQDGRGYEAGKYITSFVGFADASDLGVSMPLVMLVSVREPQGTSLYGGTVAAPIFQRAMSRVLHHLTTTQPAERGAQTQQPSLQPARWRLR